MENKTVRIRTTPGVSKNIMVELNQDFDFLEILSLKISQQDIYRSFCADYGVVVGRVISNQGFGIPNAKLSVFVPISSEDEKNELIKELYPYKTITSKNGDGYRYNLFLRETTCSINTPIGTFPTKEDVLTDDIELEIFDKYYKYTTRTNEAGDYILFGVPTGQQTIHIDVDLSDIGVLSMRPYDLIESGFAEKLFEGFTEFRQSTNLDTLAQVKTQSKGVDVVPFWGDTELCNFGITRVDFDTGIEIVPTSIFMGSVFTDSKKNDLGKNCSITNDMGEQCELTTKAGVIDILRVTYDDNGNPYTIEEFTPRAGKDVIDDDGTFTFTLPMYYDRVVTDEFGNLVPSLEPGKGIPTKGKYRFKLKFNEPGEAKNRTSASLIVPSLNRIHGGTVGTEQQRWVTGVVDNIYTNDNIPHINNVFNGNSYQLSDPAYASQYQTTIESDLNLDFHTFEWKQVYTLSHFIKKYKKGDNRFSFIGIKGCDECEYNNPFPYTTAMKKASFTFFFYKFGIQIFAAILKALLILGNLKFCGSYRLLDNGKCRKLIDFAPFEGLVSGLLGDSIELPCGDESFTLNTNCGTTNCSCPDSNGNYQPIQYGDNSDGDSPCCLDTDGNCQTDSCVSLTINIPNESECSSLDQLESWKCCSIYEAAKDNKAIKLTFFDAWLNGSAYLFQFKAKVKATDDGSSSKYKFCGPGSQNTGGNNYTNNNEEKTCGLARCLVMGPSINSDDRNYIGGADDIQVPDNAPGVTNGASDTGEFIYCNWLSSTKIISLGPIEMCEDAFKDIQDCIYTNTNNLNGTSVLDCNIADLRLGDGSNPYEGDNLGPVSPYTIPSYTSQYIPQTSYNAPQVIKVGTGGESGFDRQETTRKLSDSTFNDPSVVIQYLLKQENCDFGSLFEESAPECHEYELKESYFKRVREVCKVHNTVVTVPVEIPAAQGGGYDFDNPEVWDVNGISSTIDPGSANGPFEVDTLLRDRYHPNPNNDSDYGPNQYCLGSSHIDAKTNMPYFYFGLIPGKTAMDKFKKKYLVNK